jgi:medium-chain acyl-[acyl-carrier-protein] hydrolase
MTNSNQSASSWISPGKPSQYTKLRLFCLPYAGGGSLIYRQWRNYIHPAVDVCPVNLPGRAPRLKEACFDRIIPLAEAIGKGILPFCDMPFALFGHSMGAMLSFEVARYFRGQGLSRPSQLFVSGRRAPQVPDDDAPTYNLSDDEFLAELKRINGTPKEVLEHEDLVQLIVPIIRADFEACQTYEYRSEPALDCRITAFGGLDDDEETRERIDCWRDQTTSSFSLTMLPGDHFFIHSSQELLLKALNR